MIRSGDARYVCDDCGRTITGLGPSVACLCGGTSRRRIDTAGAMYRRPLGAESPRWDPLKDWTIKYLQLTWNVQELRRHYTAGGAEPAEVRRIVDSTFAACLGLADWLTWGPEPAAVTPGDVARFVRAEPLAVCAGLVAAGDTPVATRIVPVAFARPPQFWVDYRRSSAATVRYDALDLAERCLRAWQAFLTDRQVALPSWQR